MRKLLSALLVGIGLTWANVADALQCVPYARQASGITLSGNAWQWWSAADGVYERGTLPRPGAVLVFKQIASMRHGHVAVVSRVVDRREIRIDHANWGSRAGGRGQVERDVAVIDVSPANDWSQVRVWHQPSATFGARVNPTYGFIYPAGASPRRPPAVEHVHVAVEHVPVSVSMLPSPAVAKPAAAVTRGGADDLNRQVLARLRGQDGAGVAQVKLADTPAKTAKTAKTAKSAKSAKSAPAVVTRTAITGKATAGAMIKPAGKRSDSRR